jgi:hypothetical protein
VTFTESLPGLTPRGRLTGRLREGLAAAVGEGRIVAEVADTHAVSWDSAHRAFVTDADARLAGEPEPVTHLGIDEVRRGRPRWEHDRDTGHARQLADRWHTGFTDPTGRQGLLGQVEDRAGADVIDWLGQRSPAWRTP